MKLVEFLYNRNDTSDFRPCENKQIRSLSVRYCVSPENNHATHSCIMKQHCTPGDTARNVDNAVS